MLIHLAEAALALAFIFLAVVAAGILLVLLAGYVLGVDPAGPRW